MPILDGIAEKGVTVADAFDDGPVVLGRFDGHLRAVGRVREVFPPRILGFEDSCSEGSRTRNLR